MAIGYHDIKFVLYTLSRQSGMTIAVRMPACSLSTWGLKLTSPTSPAVGPGVLGTDGPLFFSGVIWLLILKPIP